MRAQAIENCAKLLVLTEQQGDYQAFNQYAAKLKIITDRSNDKSASVIKELCNMEVKL